MQILKPHVSLNISNIDASVALGRKGGKKGGKARAERMSAEERSKAARKAALARWGPSDQ